MDLLKNNLPLRSAGMLVLLYLPYAGKVVPQRGCAIPVWYEMVISKLFF
jgi:hypothetical protein